MSTWERTEEKDHFYLTSEVVGLSQLGNSVIQQVQEFDITADKAYKTIHKVK